MHPDIIVAELLHQLAHEGTGGVTFTRLWELLPSSCLNNALFQAMVYSWLKNNKNLELLIGDGIQTPLPGALDQLPEGALVRVTDEFQWIELTGAVRENNVIGNAAYELLVEIARHRSQGIDTLHLMRNTGQDNRSSTSRIKVISHLIKKFTVLRNGRTLSLLILNEYFSEDALKDFQITGTREVTINIPELKKRMTDILKAAKNGIRQMSDLRRELELDKSLKSKRIFKSMATYLETKGCVEKLLVVSSVSSNNKIRSLKYIKDYVPNNVQDESDSEDDFNDEMIDDDLKDEEDDTGAPSLITNESSIITTSSQSVHTPILNRFYPAQNQLYSIISKQGIKGCSSNAIQAEVFGEEYSRLFTKWIESYTSGKLVPNLADMGLIRHYDFQGRVKFYRYLTHPNFLLLTKQQPSSTGSALPILKSKNLFNSSRLNSLNNRHYISTGAKIDIGIGSDGIETIIWRGNGNSSGLTKKVKAEPGLTGPEVTPPVVRKRGRPRKGEERPKAPKKIKVAKTKANENEPAVPSLSPVLTQEELELQQIQELINTTPIPELLPETAPEPSQIPKEKKKQSKKAQQSIISALKGTSFKALEREAALLRLLEDQDGVREGGHLLLTDLRDELGYNVDKKTFMRDINSLVSQNKILIEEIAIGDDDYDEDVTFVDDAERSSSKITSLLISVNANIDTIEHMKRVIKSRKSKKGAFKKLEEVNADIDFFDIELRDSFNRVRVPITAPVEQRVKAQKKTSLLKPKEKKPKKPKEGTIKKEPKPARYTSRMEPKEPQDQTSDELFENLRSKVRHNLKKTKEDRTIGKNGRKRRNVQNLNSEDTMILFKCVVICKTINQNQINWTKIGQLLGIGIEVLKTKWPRIRMMMGSNGVKVAKRLWKKILLNSVKEGRIEMDDIENLQLRQLVNVWVDYENGIGITDLEEEGINLFSNIEDNYRAFKFSKVGGDEKYHYDMNSMIQREQQLINSVFTYDHLDREKHHADETDENDENDEDDEDGEDNQMKTPNYHRIRDIIISIVTSGVHYDIKKIHALEGFKSEEVDAVFLKLVKRRQIVVQNQIVESQSTTSKVLLGDKMSMALDDSTFDFSFAKISRFQNFIKDLHEGKKALILDPLFDNSYMVSILELVKDGAIDITRIDYYRKEVLNGYEARTLERDKLDCDILLTKGETSLVEQSLEKQRVTIPSGKVCSHIWVDVSGNVNIELWQKVLKLVIATLISKPGVLESGLQKQLKHVLSPYDLSVILQWLLTSKAVKKGWFGGYWLRDQWYMSLGF